MHNDYSTKPWKKVALMMMVLITIANVLWICLREDNTPRWKVAVEYPMVNSGIEWSGAGYNGIYGGAE